MIGVAHAEASDVGGCEACPRNGRVTVIEYGSSTSNVTTTMRLCALCALDLKDRLP